MTPQTLVTSALSLRVRAHFPNRGPIRKGFRKAITHGWEALLEVPVSHILIGKLERHSDARVISSSVFMLIWGLPISGTDRTNIC